MGQLNGCLFANCVYMHHRCTARKSKMYGYKERKAAQVAAYFALEAGGSINVLKLAKLLYLAERESMSRYDEPLFFDKLVSMDYGPVTSMSLDRIKGFSESAHWTEFLTDRENHFVAINSDKTAEDFDDLSRSDTGILQYLWGKFGNFDRFELAQWTHDNCPEWEDPRGSSKSISHSIVFKFLNKPNAETLANDISAYRNLASVMDAV